MEPVNRLNNEPR